MSKNSIEIVQEEPQSQNIAYQWHQEEKQTMTVHMTVTNPRKAK